jgi:hypothetical protein
MPSPNTISPDKLARLVAVPHGPAPVDVRADADFKADPRFAPGAIRRIADSDEVESAIDQASRQLNIAKKAIQARDG